MEMRARIGHNPPMTGTLVNAEGIQPAAVVEIIAAA